MDRPMTRTEARMIAEELYRLMKKDEIGQKSAAELLTAKEAAEYLKCSISFIRHNVDAIRCVRVCGKPRFTKEGLLEFVSKRQTNLTHNNDFNG